MVKPLRIQKYLQYDKPPTDAIPTTAICLDKPVEWPTDEKTNAVS